MSGTVHRVPAAVATVTLQRILVGLRGADPLAPVTVIVPSALAGATLRRGLFPNGLAGVRFTSLPQYVDGVLTAAGHSTARRTGARRRALVGTALHGSPWAASAATTDSVRLFDALLVELDEAELPAGEDLGHPDLLAVHLAYRSLLGVDELVLPADRAVAALPAAGEPVVLHLPRRMTGAELRFAKALDDRLTVVLGLTGVEAEDIDAERLAGVLVSWMTLAPHDVEPARRQQIEVSADIDAEEEVRQAVRRVLEHLGDPAHRADRVAFAYRSAVPYARLIHEQLTAAGLPHHVPRQRSLAQTITGSALIGLLGLADDSFGRPQVALWWSGAPLLDRSGQPISATRWDRLAREAGVTRGRTTWDRRLADAHRRAQDRLTQADDEQRPARERTVEQLAALRAEMADLFVGHDGLLAATSWQECSTLCVALLDRHLGSASQVRRWHPRFDDAGETSLLAEQAAHTTVRQVLLSLGALDEQQSFPGLAGFRDVLDAELARPLRESSGLARGVLVSPIGDLVGADLDLLLVLGLVEGAFPPRAREHPVLRDEGRALSSGRLRTTNDRRRAERRDFALALTTAPRVVLSWPAADTRSRRATHPSPWLLEHCGKAPAPASFTARTRQATSPLSLGEHDLQQLLAGGRVSPDHPLAGQVPGLARGLEAVAARSDMTYGPWTGQVGPLEDLPLSASGLQKYANCPRSFLLDKILGIRDRDDPQDEASPLDVGLVVHAALEDFFGEHLGRSPDEAWTTQELAEAHSYLDHHAGLLADKGKAGRPLVWELRTRQMHRSLRRTLLADDAWRRTTGAVPRKVELGFGLDDAELEAVEVLLPSGRTVSLRGSIDRVDEHPDGSLTVLDWKTGKDRYGALAEQPLDLVGQGAHLQLPLYARAAVAWHGRPTPVSAYYVVVDHDAQRRGGLVDQQQVDRLNVALETLTTGVNDGHFPANPGQDGFYGWERCGFCAFERLCPSSRGAQWESIRHEPALADYRGLTESGSEPGPS